MTPQRIVLAGGSGFLGHGLIKEFEGAGYEVVVLSRSRKMEPFKKAIWDGETLGEWAGMLNGAAAIVNLSGEPATLLWTEENKRKIIESRTKSTAVIGKAIRSCANPPKTWINASGVGYYGDRGDEMLDESSAAGDTFLAEVCLLWERAQEEAETPETKKVRIRIGAALGAEGGAFAQLAKFTNRFMGGSQGSGKQWMSWIHLDDLTALFRWAIESGFEGVVNGVGPEPARNRDLMAAMRDAMGRPWSPPAPGFAVKFVSRLIGMQADAVLESQRAKSQVLSSQGFEYKFPDLDKALEDLVRQYRELHK